MRATGRFVPGHVGDVGDATAKPRAGRRNGHGGWLRARAEQWRQRRRTPHESIYLAARDHSRVGSSRAASARALFNHGSGTARRPESQVRYAAGGCAAESLEPSSPSILPSPWGASSPGRKVSLTSRPYAVHIGLTPHSGVLRTVLTVLLRYWLPTRRGRCWPRRVQRRGMSCRLRRLRRIRVCWDLSYSAADVWGEGMLNVSMRETSRPSVRGRITQRGKPPPLAVRRAEVRPL